MTLEEIKEGVDFANKAAEPGRKNLYDAGGVLYHQA